MCKYIIQIYHFQKLSHVTDEINCLIILLDEAYRYNHYDFLRFFFCSLLSNKLENNQFKFVVFVTTLVQTNSIEKLQSQVARHLRLRPNPLYGLQQNALYAHVNCDVKSTFTSTSTTMFTTFSKTWPCCRMLLELSLSSSTTYKSMSRPGVEPRYHARKVNSLPTLQIAVREMETEMEKEMIHRAKERGY